MTSPRSRGQRAGLTRSAVITAARRIIAGSSTDRLSMRTLATALGVSPTALYGHVRSRDDLLDALLDDVLGGIDTPPRGDVADRIRTVMVDAYDALRANPALLPVFVERQGARGPNADRLGAVVLHDLRAAGLDSAGAAQGLHLLVAHAIGFAVFSSRPGIDRGGRPTGSAAASRHDFSIGIGWLIRGLLDDASPSSTP